MTDINMKELLRKMFTGWMLHEASWDAEKKGFTRNSDECMTEACGGNTLEAYMIHLFDYWGNDIQALAPHFGIFLGRDENGKLFIKDDIPPAPSIEHAWQDNQWVLLKDECSEATVSESET